MPKRRFEEEEGGGASKPRTTLVSHAFKNEPLPNLPQKRLPDVPDQLPALPAIFGFIGPMGSGKSVTMANLCRDYKKAGSLNMFFIISPTFEYNEDLKTIEYEEGGVFSGANITSEGEAAMEAIKQLIITRKTEYEFEEDYRRVFKLWRGPPKDQMKLGQQDWYILQKENYRNPVKIPWPCPCIIIDDMTHTSLMSASKSNTFTNLCLRHRHFEGIGITMMAAFQTYHGCHKDVRVNLKGIAYYPDTNRPDLEKLKLEHANNLSLKTFMRFYADATDEQHNFFFINKTRKDKKEEYYSKCMKELYVYDPVKEVRMALGLDPEKDI